MEEKLEKIWLLVCVCFSVFLYSYMTESTSWSFCLHLFCVATEAPEMLSRATSQGPVWHFPPRQALRVELEPDTSISELLQPLSSPSSPPPSLSLSQSPWQHIRTHTRTSSKTYTYTQTHTHTHLGRWWPCSSCQEEPKRSAPLQGVCMCACNQCLIFVPFAPDSTIYDNPHVISEREMVS